MGISIYNNKIVIAGMFTTYNNNTLSSPYLLRLNYDGTLDTTFKVPKFDNTITVFRDLNNGNFLFADSFYFLKKFTIDGTEINYQNASLKNSYTLIIKNTTTKSFTNINIAPIKLNIDTTYRICSLYAYNSNDIAVNSVGKPIVIQHLDNISDFNSELTITAIGKQFTA